MKYVTTSSILILTILGLNRASAELPYITPVNYPLPMTAGRSVSGQVTNIDSINQMIQVRDAAQMLQTIHVDAGIQILRNDQSVQLTSLNLGDTVTVIAQSR